MKEKMLYERKALRAYTRRLYKVFDQIYLEHADVKGQPVGFKEKLVHPEYQQLDDRAWQSGQYRKECYDGEKRQILVADQSSEKTA